MFRNRVGSKNRLKELRAKYNDMISPLSAAYAGEERLRSGMVCDISERLFGLGFYFNQQRVLEIEKENILREMDEVRSSGLVARFGRYSCRVIKDFFSL